MKKDINDCVSLALCAVVGVVISLPVYIAVMHSATDTPLPPGRVGFQASSGGRSTMGIVSECLATMFICVVTAVHFDIPPRPANKRSFWTELCSGGWMIRMWKLGWWIAALLAVEFVASKAVDDLLKAKRDFVRMHRRGFHRWTLKMSFFALMGGFDVDGGTALTGMTLADKLNIRGDTQAPEGVATLDFDAIEDDISDKSKADGLAKFLAVLQISRFLLGTATRLARSLPISPLEYVTCSYVVCAVAVYAFWFNKPCGVESPIRLTPHSVYLSANGTVEPQGSDTQPASKESTFERCRYA